MCGGVHLFGFVFFTIVVVQIIGFFFSTWFSGFVLDVDSDFVVLA